MGNIRTALAVLPLLLCILFTGCGKSIFFPYAPPAPAATASGNWYITGYYAVGGYIDPYSFGGSLLETGSQLTGVFHINQPCFGNAATDIPHTGTLDSNNNLSIVSTAVAGQVLTLTGTLSTSDSILTNGFFSVSGGCTGSIVSQTFGSGPGAQETNGIRIPSLTGAWTPNFIQAGPSLTEQLTQSATPDAHGDFALTGTVTVQGSPCFTQGTLQTGSFVSGNLGQQIILMNDGSTLNATLQVTPQIGSIKALLHLYPGAITGGTCDGPVDIDLQ